MLRPLGGLFTTQFLGAFNDNAWKQIVIFLALDAAATTAGGQEHTAFAQIVIMIPLLLISMPAGLLADRFSKRSVILGSKVFELGLMLFGVAALIAQPNGGPMALTVLGLLGVQAALFVPAKGGIIPELVPHQRLSAANGVMEMGSNLAVLGGMVGGGLICEWAKHSGAPLWIGGLLLAGFSACGVASALAIPRVAPRGPRAGWLRRSGRPGKPSAPIAC